jgi:hypothetical protein
MADELTAAGKYFLISVPDFANDPVGRAKALEIPKEGEPGAPEGEDELEAAKNLAAADRRNQPMTAFLRMGSFHENAASAGGAVQRSYELAKQAQVVSTSQGGPPTLPFGAEVDNLTDVGIKGVDGDKERGVFLGDQRNKYDKDGTKHSVAERLEQSAALLSRGGWWDHSDGNRVSTTYGDKVEVIRGNYKMVVMHRQDSPANSGGWDLSGGHIQDLGPASMPGASVRLEFRPGTFGQKNGLGTWHLENTTNNFNQTSDFAGDFYEHWYGDHKESTTGSENPQPFNEALAKPYGNPAIIEKTWASKIEGYTVSSAWRIPSIKEETYATTTSSLTDVSSSITETTYCDGTISSSTGSAARRVPKMSESTYATLSEGTTDVLTSIENNIIGAATITNTIGASAEVTTAATLNSLTMVGVTTDITLAGALEEVTLAAHHGSLEVALHADEIFLGTKLSIQLGPVVSFEYPETKELRIKDVKAAIDKTTATLKEIRAAIQFTRAAMKQDYVGMMIALGI